MPETPDDHHLPHPTGGPDRPDQEAALIAAAASDDLGPDEAEEYAALVAADPGVADETAPLRTVLERLDALAGWQDPEPSAALVDRVLAIPDTDTGARGTAPGTASPLSRDRRRGARRWLPAVAAAVVLLLAGGAVGSWVGEGEEAAPTGPPGTLGALEPIDFRGEPGGVDIEASLVAHTWGTEAVLSMDGFDPGDRYAVVLRGNDGRLEDSGTFLGSTVPIDCRLNAALLREDVDAVEIHDADGGVVATSDVPRVQPS